MDDVLHRLSEAEALCAMQIDLAITVPEDQLPGLMRTITLPLKAISDCATKCPVSSKQLGQSLSACGTEKKPVCHQSCFVNINVSTSVLHTENDCTYTIIHVPNGVLQSDCDSRFEFSIFFK